MDKGLVIKSTGSRYRVMLHDGSVSECTVRGKLRIRGVRTTNPIAVGDNVILTPDGPGRGIITEVLDRRNYILRKASNLSRHSQIIAANIDQVLLMATVILPETPAEFIDRFLVTAEAYRIPAVIIINKADLYGPGEMEKAEYLRSVYERIGYKCLIISLKMKPGAELLIPVLEGKISLVSGNSGVGKSSLLNVLNPGLELRTEEISDYHRQGKHVTTFPEMHPMPFGGYVIDTPGIRGFGVVNMERNEIYHFFPEIFAASHYCRFNSCLHVDEPGCAVAAAVESGDIDPGRYRSYLNILSGDDRKYR